MEGAWSTGGIVMMLVCLLPACTPAQSLVWRDTAVVETLSHLDDGGRGLLRYRIRQGLEYSFSFSGLATFDRKPGPGMSMFSLLQHLRYHALAENCGSVRLTGSFVQDLGVQCFVDSLSRFFPDESTLLVKLDAGLSGNLLLSFYSQVVTRLKV